MTRAPARTPLIVVAIVLGLLGALAFGMYAYDHARRDQLADGIRVDGIPVGGLSTAAATARLQRNVAAEMRRPVLVREGSHTWELSPRAAGLSVDVAVTVSSALAASREGSIFARTWRELAGGSVNRDLPLRVSYSRRAVSDFVGEVRAAVDVQPRDASVEPTGSGLTEVPQRDGLAVERKRLTERVVRALNTPVASRVLSAPTLVRHAKVTTSMLASEYPAYIVIDRASFRLLFYQHLKLASTYEIAVGMQGLETEPGLYHVQWKQVDPPWYVPNSAWAGALAGKTIPPGPEDPLKARFMAFNGGAGIHGIDPSEYSTIGHDASHGCVRMRIPDVISLYARTPVGTPVYVL
ncbi:MAG TPA: L,D-transpeptidase/peptidoglycan binding protein [Solirubrobacteraceae bacterium]|jgi:lipoprotein-anchoring transpeptidase ErfK/SrfK|nr:L,D-transpeptidase/peptidoglycan binding protein [Solirubrobacteraceae bacterium]